jgi:Aspartyl-tRNA synthetase
MERTDYCGTLKQADAGRRVALFGWVHSRRDHGGVVFIDLRDRTGIVQVVFQPANAEVFAKAEKLRGEFVVKVLGSIRPRPAGTENANVATGMIEVVAETLDILNTAPALPFEISDHVEVSEEVRLKYRFLDLRRPSMQNNFITRHKMLQETRTYLANQGFLEIETPFLTKSTPEGARDFLVPSRLTPGEFYALPQSPQLFKQILMVAGF